jgi:hypothetical protein
MPTIIEPVRGTSFHHLKKLYTGSLSLDRFRNLTCPHGVTYVKASCLCKCDDLTNQESSTKCSSFISCSN